MNDATAFQSYIRGHSHSHIEDKYHTYRGNNIINYGLKSCIFIEVGWFCNQKVKKTGIGIDDFGDLFKLSGNRITGSGSKKGSSGGSIFGEFAVLDLIFIQYNMHDEITAIKSRDKIALTNKARLRILPSQKSETLSIIIKALNIAAHFLSYEKWGLKRLIRGLERAQKKG